VSGRSDASPHVATVPAGQPGAARSPNLDRRPGHTGKLPQAGERKGHGPAPSFSSPFSREGTLALRPFDLRGNLVQGAKLYVGDYEAHAVPVADTDPATPLGDTVDLVPGDYHLIVAAPGHGARRAEVTIKGGQTNRPALFMPENLASSANGATATGDGINLGALIDDTEATNWASLNSAVAGKTVTLKLDPSRPWHLINRVQVSAQLRPQIADDPGGDTQAQSRFSALRQFEVWTCRRPGRPGRRPRQRHRLRRRLDAGRQRPRGRAAAVQVTIRMIATIVP